MPDDCCNDHGTGGAAMESAREDPWFDFDIVLPTPPKSAPTIIASPRLILRTIRDSDAEGLSYQFVILLADDPAGRIIGTVGINELVPAPTLGYIIHPDEWGKGYATEATSAMTKAWWSLPRRGKSGQHDKIYALCNENNLGSL
ncbi:hypothetical protein EMCG_03400 [[Emmonsia] crescens]|uniref:N-acetyltransferase domain-containing protein n=1 Tax=[Emmonsia] crescens TaxID=73230 RepID=A0A0G2J8E8_9EURO|nr:hypothetical protein EMCG_03400 [Emmonsia crescens UAMH 3008]